MTSIMNGLFAGRSGLNTHGLAMAVIGDNIANVNTVGHKASRVEFSDLIAGQSSNITSGIGSQIEATTQVFEQGTLEFTGRALDAGIDGGGHFIVSDGTSQFYSRAGNFKINADGELVTQGGLQVLGFPSNGSGALESLNVNTISQDNVTTNNVTLSGNLDARATALTNGATDIPAVSTAGEDVTSTTTYADLNNAAEFSTAVDVFDSQGGAHTLTFFFYKTATNEYTVRGYVNSEDVDATGTATGLPRQLVEGATTGVTLSFDSDGTITTGTDINFAITTPWNNGSAKDGSATINFDPFTQFSTTSNLLSIAQDGQGVGNITNISIGNDGVVSSILDNGQKATIGTIALADFSNPEALTRLGSQLFQKSTTSGEPVVGKPQTGTLGVIESETVEASTVDIANEFVKMITLQRGFQANSRTISTINQLLNELMSLV